MLEKGTFDRCLCIVIFIMLFHVPIVMAQEDFIVTIGQNKTFTEFNFHDAWFENDPNNPEPWPDPNQREAYSVDNIARVSLTATPGHACVAQALTGVQFSWNLTNYTWEEVKDIPIEITVDFNYQIDALYYLGSGSADARINIMNITDPWYDSVGYGTGLQGPISQNIVEKFSTTWDGRPLTVEEIDRMERRIVYRAYSHTHSAYNGGATHYSFANISINSIKIEFLSKCDFSNGQYPTEKCFGGIGPQCQGWLFRRVVKHQDTCLVDGWMSTGSILHDICCFVHKNDGFMCAGTGSFFKRNCRREWASAYFDWECGLYWSKTFGPYFFGKGGDDTSMPLRAPRNAKVNPKDQDYCQSGQCQKNAKGKPIIYGLPPCRFCLCE